MWLEDHDDDWYFNLTLPMILRWWWWPTLSLETMMMAVVSCFIHIQYDDGDGDGGDDDDVDGGGLYWAWSCPIAGTKTDYLETPRYICLCLPDLALSDFSIQFNLELNPRLIFCNLCWNVKTNMLFYYCLFQNHWYFMFSSCNKINGFETSLLTKP